MRYSREGGESTPPPSQERHDGNYEENQDGHKSYEHQETEEESKTTDRSVWKRAVDTRRKDKWREVDRNTVYSQVGKQGQQT